MKGFQIVLATIVILALSTHALGQKQTTTGSDVKRCPLTIEQSPVVRGFKLGQSVSDVRSLFADEADDTFTSVALGFESVRRDDIGLSHQFISGTLLRTKTERLKQIDNIELRYLDDGIASFNIQYDRSVRWQSSAHFAAAIAEQLHLPNTGWLEGTSSVRLICDGFYVDVSAFAINELTVSRTDLEAEIARRRAKREQQKRADFKP